MSKFPDPNKAWHGAVLFLLMIGAIAGMSFLLALKNQSNAASPCVAHSVNSRTLQFKGCDDSAEFTIGLIGYLAQHPDAKIGWVAEEDRVVFLN